MTQEQADDAEVQEALKWDNDEFLALHANFQSIKHECGCDIEYDSCSPAAARVLASALRASMAREAALRARIAEYDKSINAEMRDPNGTIWEVANQFLTRAETAESRLAEARRECDRLYAMKNAYRDEYMRSGMENCLSMTGEQQERKRAEKAEAALAAMPQKQWDAVTLKELADTKAALAEAKKEIDRLARMISCNGPYCNDGCVCAALTPRPDKEGA